MIPSVARSGIAWRHVARSVRGVDAIFLPKLAPAVVPPAAGASFPIAYPHRGDAVPGAARVSAVASGCYRRRGAVVLVPGAVDSLGRIPAPVGGPRGPEFSSFIGHLRLVAEAEDGSCETVFIGTKVPLQGQVG